VSKFIIALREGLGLFLAASADCDASLDAERFTQDILKIDPVERPSAEALLQHPYLSDFHCETPDGDVIDEPSRPRPLDLKDFHFDYPTLQPGARPKPSERMLLDELWTEFEMENRPRTTALGPEAIIPAAPFEQ